jgi:hypothetical protein
VPALEPIIYLSGFPTRATPHAGLGSLHLFETEITAGRAAAQLSLG